MRVRRCKGTRDLAPEEMTRFRLIEGVFRDCCLKWGYDEVRTPILEYLHLFTSTGTLTPSMLNKVYSFLDWDGWSGERVVLRPDCTIPVARLYIDSMEDGELAKLFYVADVFRFEETGTKTRERWQCGVELIGIGSAVADVELIVLALEVLRELGLKDIELRLSHIGLIRALLMKLDLGSEEQTRLFDEILDGNIDTLAKLKPKDPELGRALGLLLDLKGESSGFLKNLKTLFIQSLPELESPLNDFISIVDLLGALGCDYHIDLASGRGFEYYTGVTFQFFIRAVSVGGGGRYDDLIPLMGGRNVPASGFALYFDRLLNLLKSEALAKPPAQSILIRVQPEAMKEGFSIASCFHEAGYAAELQLGSREPADFRWTLDVREKMSPIVLTDQVQRRKFEVQNMDEVLTLLEKEEGVNKNSTA